MKTKIKLGWKPDIPDHRDFYKLEKITKTLPRYVYLAPYCPPVYEQGELGSCTAQAVAAAIEFDRQKDKMPPLSPSQLFIYYNTRVLQDTINYDSGATLRDTMKTVNQQGYCKEAEWTYNINKFAIKPSLNCYQNALLNKVPVYSRVNQTINSLKQALVNKSLFVFGMSCYESFLSDTVAQNGIVPMPGQNEGFLGGHAVCAVGYNDSYKRFLVRNSWGYKWGLINNPGYFTIPYDYVLNTDLCCDFWVIN
jgi:C1A family cysteine protease